MLLWFILLAAAPLDPLGPEFEKKLAQQAKSACGRDFRLSVGAANPTALVRSLTGGEDGKELYVQFLKDRYGYTIARVNEIYSTDVSSFTELLTHSFAQANPQRPELIEDDAAFLDVLKARWTAVIARHCKARLHLELAHGHLAVKTTKE